MRESKNNYGTSDHIPVNLKKEALKAADSLAKKLTNPSGNTEINLSDGRVATCITAKGKHVIKAQRLMDGDPGKMLPALIATCTSINDKMVTLEELEEMPAGDFMALMGHFGTAFQ